ncbi:uncharacterized protein CANTADRAFT_293649 [Suhomyces tanzawaensis NRRL Y-17324]|uniref:Uncharacterized protein n=1 Tax=Suhomyces tanzawaensis NRRL Y-17324 TaxID=984487 RepID=A0A1E4SEW1_9ASCO|nr:uncharacterized protein CANTADRAFT_293649 [Suhomyces tanzawaensis NRRL Y-17324]ODV78020.1 hypothetical protein CANTADRAFT_293649 [Suhomyces tanzawaensis NRRL Y-17324]
MLAEEKSGVGYSFPERTEINLFNTRNPFQYYQTGSNLGTTVIDAAMDFQLRLFLYFSLHPLLIPYYFNLSQSLYSWSRSSTDHLLEAWPSCRFVYFWPSVAHLKCVQDQFYPTLVCCLHLGRCNRTDGDSSKLYSLAFCVLRNRFFFWLLAVCRMAFPIDCVRIT